MNYSLPDAGVAMIVKNAVKDIGRALNSVRNVARQIVVVDTGSDDRTPEIACGLGAEVHFFQWRDSFSAARNYALKAMRTAWILQLDADEELLPDGIDAVSAILSDDRFGGASMRIINDLADETQSEHRFTRLFRNHSDIRYAGNIHEQIAPSIIKAGYNVAESSLCIRHYGYAENSPQRAARNIALLERELSERPDDDWLRYHLASALFTAKMYGKSGLLFNEICDSRQLSVGQREYAKLRAAQAAVALDEPDRAEAYLGFHSVDPAREGLRLYVLALSAAASRNFTQAAALLRSPEVGASSLVHQDEAQKFLSIFESMTRRA